MRGPSVTVDGMQKGHMSSPRHGAIDSTRPSQHFCLNGLSAVDLGLSNMSLPVGVHSLPTAAAAEPLGWQYMQVSPPRQGVLVSISPGQHGSAVCTLLSYTSVPATVHASPTAFWGTQYWQISVPRHGVFTSASPSQQGSETPALLLKTSLPASVHLSTPSDAAASATCVCVAREGTVEDGSYARAKVEAASEWSLLPVAAYDLY